MMQWEILFDDFGRVCRTVIRSVSAESAAEEFADVYGYDVVDVKEVIR